MLSSTPASTPISIENTEKLFPLLEREDKNEDKAETEMLGQSSSQCTKFFFLFNLRN